MEARHDIRRGAAALSALNTIKRELGDSVLERDDLQVLKDAAEANPQWMKAILLSAEVMAARRKKWSGQTGPYANFIRWGQMNGVSVERVFMWATTLKLTRDQDAEAVDDTLLDNVIDGINYPALRAGWLLMSAVEKLEAMLELGPWIDSRLLSSWVTTDEEALDQHSRP